MSSEEVHKSDEYREEVLEMMREVAMFGSEDDALLSADIEDILRSIATFRARVSWLRAGTMRAIDNRFIRLRNDILDPFLGELEEQFRIWSRILTIKEFEWKMSR